MKKRILAIGLGVLMALALLTGCNGAAETAKTSETVNTTESAGQSTNVSAGTETTNEQKLIGINIALADNEFFQMVEYGIKKDFDSRGWKYLVTYGVGEKISENGATFLGQNVDAIVEFGCDQNYGNPLVQAATEKDVPVICVDVAYEGAYFFGANNDQAGTLLGEAMVDWVNARWDGQVDVIYEETNSATSPVVALRVDNAVKVIQEELGVGDDLLWKVETSQDSTDSIKQKLVDYLSGNPDKKHIMYISMSAANMPPLLGAVDTIGKSDVICFGTHSEESFIFQHFDETSAETDNFVGCVAYRPTKYGEYIGKMLETLFSGGTLEQETLMDHVVVTRENYKEFQEEYLAVLADMKE